MNIPAYISVVYVYVHVFVYARFFFSILFVFIHFFYFDFNIEWYSWWNKQDKYILLKPWFRRNSWARCHHSQKKKKMNKKWRIKIFAIVAYPQFINHKCPDEYKFSLPNHLKLICAWWIFDSEIYDIGQYGSMAQYLQMILYWNIIIQQLSVPKLNRKFPVQCSGIKMNANDDIK